MEKMGPCQAAGPIAAVATTGDRSRLILPRWAGDGIAAAARHQDTGPAGLASRRRVLRLGLTVGLGGLAVAGGARLAAAAAQANWRYCGKCWGLFYATKGSGVCPKGGGHERMRGGHNYFMYPDEPPPPYYQDNWRYCGKCRGLFFAGNGRGVCPQGGRHNVGTGNYVLQYHDALNPPKADEENGWRYCRKCAGLFYIPLFSGVCPNGGQHKSNVGEGDYSVTYV